jgi:tRNA(Ile)-lysidine synthase
MCYNGGMLKLLKPLPKNIVVALSGGVDSVAVCDFLRRKHTVSAAFYHHGTENSDRAALVVERFCAEHSIPLIWGMLNDDKPANQSWEEWWRNSRYAFFDGLGDSHGPIVTGHNLDDSVETYLWGAINGCPKVIPYRRNNVVRPFLTTQKSEFIGWAERHSLQWSEDASNTDLKYTRNRIRHKLLPEVLAINPGIHKVVRRIVESREKLSSSENV